MTKLTRCVLRILHHYKKGDDNHTIDFGGLLNEVIHIIDRLEFSPQQLGDIAALGKGLDEHHRTEPKKKNVPFLSEYFEIKIWIDSRDSGLFMLKKIAAIAAIVNALHAHQKICK